MPSDGVETARASSHCVKTGSCVVQPNSLPFIISRKKGFSPFSFLDFSWLSSAICSPGSSPFPCLQPTLAESQEKIDDDLRMSSSQVPIPSHLRSKSPLSPPEIPSNNRTTSVTKKMSQDYDEFEFEYTKVSLIMSWRTWNHFLNVHPHLSSLLLCCVLWV